MRQKSLLRKSGPPKIASEYPASPPHLLASYGEDLDPNGTDVMLDALKSKLEACHLSLLDVNNNTITRNEVNYTTSSSSGRGSVRAGPMLIVSRQGTVRGNLNHVKTSLKEIFREPKITHPVLNAQLNNNTNYEQLVKSLTTFKDMECEAEEVAKKRERTPGKCASPALTPSKSSECNKISTVHCYLAVC